MISFGNKALGDKRRRPLDMMNDVFYKGEWLETDTDPMFSPTVFLAEQPANRELAPHFHRQNQFQLFVEGTGTIGKETIKPFTVHYAGAYTGYGPIMAGPEGLKYFTIRAVHDNGFTLAAEWRGNMIRGPKLHAEASAGEPWSDERLSNLQDVEHETPIVPSKGMGAVVSRIPPSREVLLAPIEQSVGQFIFVLAGSAVIKETRLEPWECAFVPAIDGSVIVAADENGAQVIALHMPVTAQEYLTPGAPKTV
jgi:hypothetical protein